MDYSMDSEWPTKIHNSYGSNIHKKKSNNPYAMWTIFYMELDL